MLLWKGAHSSIITANWFVSSSNPTNSVKEEQLNSDRHRGQGGEQHCPFCRQPKLDYIPVKFGYTCGRERTGLPLLTGAIYVRLGATETPEPHGDNCSTNIDSHQWVTSLLPPLLLALFGNGLVERRAVQSSRNTGCSCFLTSPLLQAAPVQNTIHLILTEMVEVRLIMTNSWAPIHVLHAPWITPVIFTKSREGLYPVLLLFASWALPILLLGHCSVPARWAKPSTDSKLKQQCWAAAEARSAADTDTTCTWIWTVLWSLKDLKQCLVPDLREHTRNIHLKAHPNFSLIP